MSKNLILVADADTAAVKVFSQALGEQWEVLSAPSGTAALKSLNDRHCQVVVANVDLPELDGAELLNRIRAKHPKTIRFMAARDEDKQRVLKTARGAHQFLNKPYDPAAIKDAIERALALDVWVGNDRMRETIARIRTLPTIPTLYVEVVAALRSPDSTTEEIGAIIAKDMAMMTKLLQLLNSACFGLTREIADPAEAVGILGFETVKAMVMSIKLLNQYDKLDAAEFSIDRLWQHSTAVARSARQLTLLETGDRALADAAFTAGLLHDLGKVVLAANFESTYSGALLLGYKQNIPAWAIEKDLYGANHGEIGAYLLGLWGMPLTLLEATALHHEPSRSSNKAFSPLTAVHVANVLERERSPDELGMISPQLDEAYLDSLGLQQRVMTWREAVLGPDAIEVAPKPNVAEVVNPVPAASIEPALVPANFAPSQTESQSAAPAGLVSRYKWLLVGAGASAVLFLAWLMLDAPKGSPTATAPVATAQSAPARPVIAVPARSVTEVASVPAKQVDSATEKPATNTPAGNSVFAPTIVRARETTNEPAAVVVPKPPPAPEFKLQGIFFSLRDPSAIINGRTIHPNERIDGARVVSITASSVTLDIQNQRKVLTVR